MSLSDAEMAKSFDADVVPRYGKLFVELVAAALPKRREPLVVLDFACGTGFATLPLLASLQIGSRVVAVSDDRFSLKAFHQKIDPPLRETLFLRKEDPRRLPFASAVFDWAFGCFPAQQPEALRQAIRQALRVVRPGGILTVCAPLENSFIELTSLATAAARDTQLPSLERRLAERPMLLSLDAWEKLLVRVGGTEIRATTAALTIPVQPPPSQDRLFAVHLAPLWLGAVLDDVAGLPEAVDRLRPAAATVSAQIGCIQCTRGLAEIDDSTAP